MSPAKPPMRVTLDEHEGRLTDLEDEARSLARRLSRLTRLVLARARARRRRLRFRNRRTGASKP